MAAGNWIVYDSFKQWMADGTFNLASDTFKITLHTNTYAPSLSNQVYADLTNELATANGYTNGGATLASVTWTKSASTTTFTSAYPTWNASGGSLVFRKAVIRKSGTANGHVDPLVCYCVLDASDITITDGSAFTIQMNASGIITVSGATS